MSQPRAMEVLIRSLVWSGLALALGVTPMVAQFGEPAWHPEPWRATTIQGPVAVQPLSQQETVPGHRNPLILAAGGVVGYVATRAAIQVLEGILSRGNCDPCLLGVAAVPLFLAIPTLTPLGVHLANERRGSLGVDWLASTAVAIGVVIVGARQGASGETLLIAVPVSAIFAAVASEILTTPRRPAPPAR